MDNSQISVSDLHNFLYCQTHFILKRRLCIDEDNSFIRRGNVIHERVNKYDVNIRSSSNKEITSFKVYNTILDLYGICDMVVFQDDKIFPVEYKVRKNKNLSTNDLLQLTAQVLCLEEMFNITIPKAAFLYADQNKREYIDITEEHKQMVKDTVKRISALEQAFDISTIASVKTETCRSCSIVDQCHPHKKIKALKEKTIKNPPDAKNHQAYNQSYQSTVNELIRAALLEEPNTQQGE